MPWQIDDHFHEPPGMCMEGHSDTGAVLDLGVYDRAGNRLYLCARCVRDAARAMGVMEHTTETVTVERTPTEAEIGAYIRRQLGGIVLQPMTPAQSVADVEGAQYTCDCGRHFATQQGLAAHTRHCEAVAR